MQIVIPMSGFGERFRKVGYLVPKPLIMIDGKTIIQHVVEMFPGEKDITFICNEDHLNEDQYRMGEILKEIAPECKVFPKIFVVVLSFRYSKILANRKIKFPSNSLFFGQVIWKIFVVDFICRYY